MHFIALSWEMLTWNLGALIFCRVKGNLSFVRKTGTVVRKQVIACCTEPEIILTIMQDLGKD